MRSRMTIMAVVSAFLMGVLGAISPAAVAQTDAKSWPQRPVRFILPFGPASGADIAARLLAEKLQVIWDKPVVIEGKPGGDGLLSVGTVTNARDDHVLFFGPTSAYVVHPYVHENLPYDPDRDLTPIAGVAKVLIAIGVPAALGPTNLKEFVAYAKANAGKVSFGVAPGFSEFVFNGFVREQGLQMAKVPYRDITTSPTDLGEGRIQLSMLSYAALRPHAQSGRVKVIALADGKRSDIAAGVPSAVESGFPSLVASPVLGLLGPRDMSLELRRKIAADLVAVVKDKTVGDRLAVTGQTPDPMDVDTFAAAVQEQKDRVAAIAKLLGMARKK